MITDAIGWHKVLLLINHNHYNVKKKDTSRTNISNGDNALGRLLLQFENSNLVHNHMSNWQNQMTMKQESDLLVTSMITDRIREHEVLSCYQLIKTITKLEKETGHQLTFS